MEKGQYQYVGVMMHGQVNATEGSYCIRGGDFCYCDKLDVPDVCSSTYEEYKDEDWVDSYGSSSSDSSSSKDEFDEKWDLKTYKHITKHYEGLAEY